MTAVLAVLVLAVVLAAVAVAVHRRTRAARDRTYGDLYARCVEVQRRHGVPADVLFARADTTGEEPEAAARAVLEEEALGRVFEVGAARARLLIRYPDLVHVIPPDLP